MTKTYPVVMILFSWLSAFAMHSQMILLILSMEIAVLGVFIMYIMNTPILSTPLGLAFYILVMGAIEASVGLSLVIIMTRQYGKDSMTIPY